MLTAAKVDREASLVGIHFCGRLHVREQYMYKTVHGHYKCCNGPCASCALYMCLSKLINTVHVPVLWLYTPNEQLAVIIEFKVLAHGQLMASYVQVHPYRYS